jgi:hypothetical protein
MVPMLLQCIERQLGGHHANVIHIDRPCSVSSVGTEARAGISPFHNRSEGRDSHEKSFLCPSTDGDSKQ